MLRGSLVTDLNARLTIYLTITALGALVATGQSPFNWPWLAFGALVLLVGALATATSTRQAILLGWFSGAGYFGVSMHWIVSPFLVEPARHGWMAPFALVFLAFGLALFWSLAFGLAHRLGWGRASRAAALVATFGLTEFLRAYALTGFPWGGLAMIWIDTPQMQLVSLVGPQGLSVLTLLLAAAPVILARRHMSLGIGFIALAAVSAGLWGQARLNRDPVERIAAVNLRLVQPNAPQREKWLPEKLPVFLARQLRLSSEPAATKPDLIIWPETAVPIWLDSQPDVQRQIGAVAGTNGRLILGIRRFEGRKVFNSLAVLDGLGRTTAVYDKHHLVPFGEYIPGGKLLAKLGVNGLAAQQGGGFSAGSGPALIDMGRAGHVQPLICYEAIFPNEVAATPTRPDWLLQITNDAWFGHFAGPFQHLDQARARAIEQGLPMVRVANTGISAVFDPLGRVIAQLPLGVAGKLDVPLPGALRPTLYSRTGDLSTLFMLLASLSGLLIRRTLI